MQDRNFLLKQDFYSQTDCDELTGAAPLLHSQELGRLKDEISQTDGIGGLHIFGDLENFLHFLLYGVSAKDAHYLKTDSQHLG